MAFKLLLITTVCWVSQLKANPVVKEAPIFRNDYTYIPNVKLFLKEHKIQQKWADAVAQCSAESATLLTPKSEAETEAALLFKGNTVKYLWLGIHDMFSEGEFVTLEGKFLSEIFNTWKPSQPNDPHGNEDCLVLDENGLSSDVDCQRKFDYICSKEATNISKNTVCGTYDMGYFYNHDAKHCYKLHTIPRNWHDAFRICKAEQSHMAIINSEEEAKIFVDLLAKYPADNFHGNFDKANVYLGFSDLITKSVFMTVHGKTLQDAGYDAWSNQQPDNFNDIERCGAMFRDGHLNDLDCSRLAFFICEKNLENSLH